MRNITRFNWTLEVVEHIAKHGVTPLEVEEAAFDNEGYIRSGRDKLHYLLGTSRAGRYLFIVISTTGRAGEVRTITARDMSGGERKYYQKRGK